MLYHYYVPQWRQPTFAASCMNQWARLEMARTHEAIRFQLQDASQMGNNMALGLIDPADFRTGIEYNNRWNDLHLVTGRTIRFFPVSPNGQFARGWIHMLDYTAVHCPPLGVPPQVNDTCWIFKDAVLRLFQNGFNVTGFFTVTLGDQTLRTDIPYATFWGNLLRGQWVDTWGRKGYFKMEFQGNSFYGTFGSGESDTGGGDWNGTLTTCPGP
ncbi:MAG: hypothetical protein K0R28_6348 [Paenibacillus sp.]|jgi:hypothetical protein|nr:hypothetical protein [Paenibacillus sp.]